MRLLRIIPILAIALTIVVSGEAMAKKKKKKRKKKKKKAAAGEMYMAAYGMAGCGLGSIIFKNDGFMQTSAATFNASFYSQTFGITTGTSNCAEAPAAAAMIEQEVFLSANMNSLEVEAAMGDGDHLRALAEVMGCSSRYNEFASLTQQRYDEIFSSKNPRVVLDSYRSAIFADNSLANNCVRISKI